MSFESILYTFVEVFYKDRITVAFVKDIKGKRLHLLFPTGREDLLSHTTLISVGKKKYQGEDLILIENKLKDKHKKREELKETFDLKELWEVVVDDLTIVSSWELVELFLGRVPDCDEVAAFLRKVIEDGVFFTLEQQDTVKVRSREEVKRLLEQRERELEKTSLLAEIDGFIKGLLSGKLDSIPKEAINKWLKAFKEYLLYEDVSDYGKLIREALQRHNLQDPVKVLESLERNQLIEKDWFFELEKLRFPKEYSTKEKEEVEAILSLKDLPPHRFDLRHLFTFTVDAEETEDFDDALSFEREKDGFTLYVHIAEVSSYITPGSALWEGALERASTLYLPDGIIPMFPFELSHQKFSLREGEDKAALSFKFQFSLTGEVLSFEIIPSYIKVKRRYTYEEVDTYLTRGEPFWIALKELLDKFKEGRLRAGAMAVILPEVSVKVLETGEIVIKRVEMTPARDLIAEAMILVNHYTARFLAEKGIPAIYRSQMMPYQIIEQRDSSLYYQILQLKYMAKSELTLEPSYHSGLGLNSYTTVTSPIRRFLDLLIQYQLETYLKGEAPLSSEKLHLMLPEIQANLQRSQFLQNRRKRYFLLKYLKEYLIEEKLRGLVLEVLGKRVRLYLPDFALIGEAQGFKNVSPGQEVTVKLEKVNPWQEVLRLQIL